VAEVVFDRCVSQKGHIEDEDYEIWFRFEFLDDGYKDWSDYGDGAGSETSSQVSFSPDDEFDPFQKISRKATQSEAMAQMEQKDHHPLMIMVIQRFLMMVLKTNTF